jgi:hypothetical protein
MIDLGRPFRAPYHPARSYLLHKGLLALLSFDCWMDMLEHAGRYGAGGFNVAHFAVFDWLLPLPTPALYGGIILLVGLLSLAMVFAGAPRWGKALVAFLYTASWLISLHDSYQHHYFLSYALTWLVFVPDVSLEQASGREAKAVQGVGLAMTALTCAIVYAFTGISKSEADWRSGAVLKRLSHSRPPGSSHPGVLDPLRDVLMQLGFDASTAWHVIALNVVALQWLVAIGYVASLERDARPTHVRTWLCSLSWFSAFSFHAFAEIGGMFDIGWFSYYMLWLSLVLLAPAPWLARITAAVEREFSWLRERAREFGSRAPRGLLLALVALAWVALSWAGIALDIPGAVAVTSLAALCVLGLALWLWHEQRRLHLAGMTVAAMLSASAMFLSITSSTARFDYYRRAAGEFMRMDQLETALALYLKAERYAPRGESRRDKIDEIRSKLRERKREP